VKQIKNKKIMFRYYLITDDEENFINCMLSKGWKISSIKYGFIYEFEECELGEYICRIAFLFKEDGDSIDKEKNVMLRELLQEQNAEILNTTNRKSVIYALRKSKEGKFEINSDIDSKISEYKIRKKSCEVKSCIAIVFGCVFIANIAWIAFAEFIIALLYQYPAFKLGKVIKDLKSQRMIQE